MKIEGRDKKALDFITNLRNECLKDNIRLIVYGGYATDGNFGKLTRKHDDIDLVIFDQKNRIDFIKKIVTKNLKKVTKFKSVELKERNEFNQPFLFKTEDFSVEIYYVHTDRKPLGDYYAVVKSDGTISEEQNFSKNIVKLGNYEYEAHTPEQILVDMLYKREKRGDPPQEKHTNDIKKLEKIANMNIVRRELKKKK
jgi:hypothetical protein